LSSIALANIISFAGEEKMKQLPKLRVLLFQRGDLWVAVSLEHFIVGQGTTIHEAMRHWMSDVLGQLLLDAEAGEDPLQDTPAAPAEYLERYQASEIKIIINLSSVVQGLPALHELSGASSISEVVGDVRMAA
jgi:hypothetical protein